MNYTTLTSSETWLDLEPLSLDTVELFPNQIQIAVDLSHQILDPSQQWQTYLNALGLFGLENWLAEHSSDLNLNAENASLYQPELQSYLDGFCQLQINQFKVCLLTIGSLTDDVISVPRLALELPEYAAHFYILMEVQEELETAQIVGFFSYQDWQQQLQESLQAESDWTYSIPLSQFNLDLEQFLLQLRCLQPTQIPLPTLPNRTAELNRIQQELEECLPQLQPDNDIVPRLWQQLTWEQGVAVLTQPELLRWVYQIQTAKPSAVRVHLSDLLQLLTQPCLNVGHWLSNQFEQMAQDLSWVLVPNLSLSSAMAMRSCSEEFMTILQELQQVGVEMPPHVGGGYRDISMGQTALRLYTVTWSLESEENPEWSLLLVLGTPSGINLPSGVKLRVSDATEVLDEQDLTTETTTPYIYTQVVGSYQEKFIATVTIDSQGEESLPPFTFIPATVSL